MIYTVSTDRGQSRRLLSCGVPRYTADMYLEKASIPPIEYHRHTLCEGIDPKHWFSYRGNRDIIPSWSLSALLPLMPDEITTDTEISSVCSVVRKYRFSLLKKSSGYTARYTGGLSSAVFVESTSECPIEACVRMLELLDDRKLLKFN